MIWRLVWIGAICVVGLATAALQLDRQARVSPEIAELVPGPFRAFAQTQVTAKALANQDGGDALVAATTLVRRRPLPAENLRLLSASQFKAGLLDQSMNTMQFAAKRGWRDPVPQETMMRLALHAGDEAEAARRYVALMLRPQTSDQTLAEIGDAIFADKNGEGRKTLFGLLSDTQRWQSIFVRRALKTVSDDAYVDAILHARSAGVTFDCSQLRNSHRSLEAKPASTLSAIALRELIERDCQ